MKRLTILSVLIFLSGITLAQGTLSSQNWEKLAAVSYEKTEDEYGELFVPVFGTDIRAMEGKEITLPGYIIPFEGMFKPDHIIISSLPVAACFFCGSGGPESVAEVYMADPIKYTANAIKVTGTLELNDTDFNQLMYILKDARLEGPAN
ncbi:MAG: hypothetical protein RIC80_04015 [Cyclobacteriaceae bacterium]